jgi:hypothetical protein
VPDVLGSEWLQAGVVGVVALLFLATLGFILTAMKTLHQISDQCHAHSAEIVNTMKAGLESSTAAIVENTKQSGATEKVLDQLQTYLIKHNGG